MNNPSPNNNNKKMSSSLALAVKQGPKKPQVTCTPMLLTNRKLSTLAGDSSVSSSSKSLMKMRPSLLLPKKNGGKLGDSKFNSLSTKRPINNLGTSSNSNNQKKKIVIRDLAPFAVGASRSNGSGGELCLFVYYLIC